jgi:hypothetical protein
VPYKSAKQRAYLHVHHPKIAKRWDKETGAKIQPKTQKPKTKKR